eukprot:scaffold7420_cov97-Isochrysis_galbana.AAC.5
MGMGMVWRMGHGRTWDMDVTWDASVAWLVVQVVVLYYVGGVGWRQLMKCVGALLAATSP